MRLQVKGPCTDQPSALMEFILCFFLFFALSPYAQVFFLKHGLGIFSSQVLTDSGLIFIYQTKNKGYYAINYLELRSL